MENPVVTHSNRDHGDAHYRKVNFSNERQSKLPNQAEWNETYALAMRKAVGLNFCTSG